MVIVSTLGWIYYGWDGVIEQVTGGTYGVGIHFSTVQTFALLFYLLSLNMHVGGIESAGQLAREVRRDLVTNARELEILAFMLGLGWRAQVRGAGRAAFRRLRESYRRYAAVDPMRGAFFAALFAFGALYAFELIWVPLYDWFQFGHVFWPIFRELDPSGNPLLSQPFIRDAGIVAICLGLGLPMLYWTWDTIDGREVRRFRIRWRVDLVWWTILCVTAAAWVAWIFAPHPAFSFSSLEPSQIVGLTKLNASALASGPWLLPKMGLFPQTEYTFYPAASYLHTLTGRQVFGFYVESWEIHLANVVAKYLTFFSLCYPAFVRVERLSQRE